MYEKLLGKVLEAYEIKAKRIFSSQKGYRNEIWPVITESGQMINVTFYKNEPAILDRINRADKVSEYLITMGLPTKRRYSPRLLTLKNERIVKYVGVYEYLPGETIPWEAYTMKHIKALGKAMSDIHSYLSQYPAESFPSVYDEYLLILSRMEEYFSDREVIGAIQKKLGVEVNTGKFAEFKELLAYLKAKPGQQALHMDFVRGNILFKDSEITGILDFEKTAKGHTVMDISRTLAFLLVDCKYKTADKVQKYFLVSGYKKRGMSKEIYFSEALGQLVKMFLMYDFYKFLRHNPYEFLKQNEHYLRTKHILFKYDVISLL